MRRCGETNSYLQKLNRTNVAAKKGREVEERRKGRKGRGEGREGVGRVGKREGRKGRGREGEEE